MLQSLFLLLSLTLGLLLLSQKKQFEFRLNLEQSRIQQRESEFQRLREDFVELQSETQRLRQELQKETAKVLQFEYLHSQQSEMVEVLDSGWD
jgi:molecular chaperone GrpE (heat shock protein)